VTIPTPRSNYLKSDGIALCAPEIDTYMTPASSCFQAVADSQPLLIGIQCSLTVVTYLVVVQKSVVLLLSEFAGSLALVFDDLYFFGRELS